MAATNLNILVDDLNNRFGSDPGDPQTSIECVSTALFNTTECVCVHVCLCRCGCGCGCVYVDVQDGDCAQATFFIEIQLLFKL